MRPMRIAVFHFAHGEGGARHALYNHLKPLKDRHHFDLYTFTPAVPEKHIPLKEIFDHVHVLPLDALPANTSQSGLGGGLRHAFRLMRHVARLNKASRKIAAMINRSGYDLVYTDICRPVMAPPLLRYLTVPSVFFCQNPVRTIREPEELMQDAPGARPARAGWTNRLIESALNAFLRAVEKRNARHADTILANSHYSREYIYHAYGMLPGVIHLGADTRIFHRGNQTASAQYILSVGGFQRVKRFHTLIDALALMPEPRRPPLVLVGNRGESAVKANLIEQAAKKNVRLEVHFDVAPETLRDLYSRAFAVVFVPYMEPFGLVVPEAMACGTPVIGVREGGVREIITHEVTGLLVDRTPVDIAAAIMRLQDDPRLKDRMTANALTEVDSYWNWARAADQLERHLIAAAKSSVR